MLTHISTQDRLPSEASVALMSPFSIDELIQTSARCPTASSPGIDGLPYEVLSLIFRTESMQPFILHIYNQALTSGFFPKSWTSTCTVLLPKKGDLNLLQNWRPISLINIDAKVFARLLSARLLTHCSSLIHDAQKGFMPQRFIGDNGLMMQLAKIEAEKKHSTEICLLLDQEKAYDRVHPEYLRKVMLQFGFPPSLVSTICKLFFETHIHLNINGFITTPFTQERGLRQGDPLSPLLFNIAFDPFLRSIVNDTAIKGFQYRASPTPSDDFQRFCVRYDEYAQASNAKLNLGKIEAFSLSGRPNPTWQSFLATQGITTWHDRNSTSAIRYLVFPIYSSIAQRNAFVNELTLKIQKACALQSQRNLSFRGRVTVMNTLIYSKLWYVLRLLSVPQPDLQKFASIGYQFVTQSVFPKFKQEFLFVDRQVGGLKLLNPSKQQLVLQWKWLRPLLLSHNSRSVSTIIHYLTYSIQHHFVAIDPLLPLLFPLRRKGPLGKTNELNIFTNLFRTMDALDKSYQHTQLSPATCLQLPLSSIHRFDNPLPEHVAAGPNTPNGPSSPIARLSLRSWSKIQVSDVFFFDSHRGCLRKKRRTDIDPFPFLISRFFKALEKKRYLARTFFSAQLCDTSQLYTLYPDEYDRLRSICRWLGTTRSFLCQNVHC
ncbi:hypothetical protein G6F41_011833 [Rhizopus arrhizus]|nr:hypothetical protein G6F41_011833 [Rhizopus arrhizus]